MAGIEIRATGALLDGTYKRVVPAELRAWARGTLEHLRDFAREIAPVDTGTYRRSIRVRTSARGWDVRGVLFSADTVGKVKVIEFGFPPARAELKGRKGVYVFRRTYDRERGLVNSQSRVLAANLVRTIATGRVTGRYGGRAS